MKVVLALVLVGYCSSASVASGVSAEVSALMDSPLMIASKGRGEILRSCVRPKCLHIVLSSGASNDWEHVYNVPRMCGVIVGVCSVWRFVLKFRACVAAQTNDPTSAQKRWQTVACHFLLVHVGRKIVGCKSVVFA